MSEENQPLKVGQELYYILKSDSDHIRIVKIIGENEGSYDLQFTTKDIHTVRDTPGFYKKYFRTPAEALAERKERVQREYDGFKRNVQFQEEIFEGRFKDSNAVLVHYSEI